MLTGVHPYQFQKNNKMDHESLICDSLITKPSDAATDAKRKHELSGDLDQIIIKAASKVATDRYLTVADLVDDIHHFFNKRPVKARSASLGYRLIRNSARYKMTVSIMLLVVITFSLTAVLYTTQKKHHAVVQDIISRHIQPSVDTDRPTVIVIPLVNGNIRADMDYFSMGLSGDLIADLSRLDGIKVLSRTSVAPFYNESLDPVIAAKSLGADYVIHGLVSMRNAHVGVEINITNTESEKIIWNSKMGASIDDLFTLPNTLAIKIAQKLQIDLK